MGALDLRALPGPRKAWLLLRKVARDSGYSVADLRGPSRKRGLVRARHVAMYLMRVSGMTLVEIGQMFGARNHATVIAGVRKARVMFEEAKLFTEAKGLDEEDDDGDAA